MRVFRPTSLLTSVPFRVSVSCVSNDEVVHGLDLGVHAEGFDVDGGQRSSSSSSSVQKTPSSSRPLVERVVFVRFCRRRRALMRWREYFADAKLFGVGSYRGDVLERIGEFIRGGSKRRRVAREGGHASGDGTTRGRTARLLRHLRPICLLCA